MTEGSESEGGTRSGMSESVSESSPLSWQTNALFTLLAPPGAARGQVDIWMPFFTGLVVGGGGARPGTE